MKGVIFTEFLEMVEARFGLELTDRIIEGSALSTGGAYTSVGTYDAREMGRLVGQLSGETGIAVPDLLKVFGEHLFTRLATGYPHFLDGVDSAFGLLMRIEGVIHPEVLKLYPDAELPQFDIQRTGPEQMMMVYRSPRGLADLAEGLIRGCAAWFNETIEIEREDLSGGRNTHVRFTLTRQSSP